MLMEILLGVLALFGLLYWYSTRRFNHWIDLGLPRVDAVFPLGFMQGVTMAKESMTDVFIRHSREVGYGQKMYGFHSLLGYPVLCVQDPDLVRQVLVKDFDYFVDRNSARIGKVNETGSQTDKIWDSQLTNLRGERWKDVRATFSPIFTSGKMKLMTKLIQAVTDELCTAVNGSAGEPIDVKDVYGKYAMGSMASCVFGVDAQAFGKTESPFVATAKAVFGGGGTGRVLKFILAILPGGRQLMRAMGMTLNPKEETDFFYNVVKDAFEQRKKSKERRNDLVDLMIDAIKNEDDDEEDVGDEQIYQDMKLNQKRSKKDVGEIEVIATAMVLLIAGYETTANTLQYCTYFLAKHPEMQKRLQDEIDEAFEETSDKPLDFNTVQSLPYLDMVIHETLRLNGIAPFISRGCVKDYKVPGTSVVVKAGDGLFINVMAIHRNPEFYPEPEKFNPENFSKESKASRSPYTFLGFGHGPRACIGMRFALLETKLALISIFRNFNIKSCAETPDEIVFDPKAFFSVNPKDKIKVIAQPRK